MDDESLNWFRFAKCLVNVGNTVLQRLLNLFIKTCSFNDYHDLWLEKVDQHCCSNNLKVLWDSLHQQCLTLDAASQQIYQPLLSKWRRDIGVLPMKQQLSALGRWEIDLQGVVCNNTTQQDTLSKWSNEIQNLVTEHSSMLTYVRNWTKEFILLCYVNQLDLLNLIEGHNTNTGTLLSTFKQDLGDPANALNSCHQNEQSSFRTKQITIQTFITSWLPKLDKLIDSWALNIPGCLNQKVLQSLLIDVKMSLPRVHNIVQVNLNDFGKEWHNRLQKKLPEWSLQLKNVGGLTSDLQDLTRKWCEELMHFPSVSDLLIQNFFHSKNLDLRRLKAQKCLTEPQWSLMFPSQGNINLQLFDTTLLCILLRNVCSVCPPEFGWKGKVLDTDLYMGADLMRMRNYRNDYIGHTAHAVLTASDFEKNWSVLEVILNRLSKPLGDEIQEEVKQQITELKTCSFDPRLEIKIQLELINWYKSDLRDLDQAQQENYLGHIQTLIEKVQDLPQQYADLMSEIQDMKSMIQDLRKGNTIY
ncbi:hypothetical protein ACJMK2_005007 [Sinanodonta woodiana]|uniref:DZIP3-like HEPN domain-containing protein n=1 Tax=Sinanodonta woodiana TaxID=1069815 RepID=A0ABD3VRU3_SINWO